MTAMARWCWAFAAALLIGPTAVAQTAPRPIETPRWFAETFLDFREDAADAAREGKRLMIYFGQEVGEPGAGNEGFQGDDGRTTIYDYWGVPEHQKWMSSGKFSGEALTTAG